MTAITASDARYNFSRILNLAAYARERVIIKKHSKPVAALVSIEEIDFMDDLLTVLHESPEITARLAEVAAEGEHPVASELLSRLCDCTTLTADSFATVVELSEDPRPATPALRDLMRPVGA